MGQQESVPTARTIVSPKKQDIKILGNSRTYHFPRVQKKERVECEGMLKLQATPFKNCVEIETDEDVLFLENIEITLKYLLQSRINTNKLFLIEDIEKLIESLVYTMAYLQSKGVNYKDICSQNVFYDNGNFKLLPNELIEVSSYEKLLQLKSKIDNGELNEDEDSFVLASPEFIIALRCQQQQIEDQQIIQKSNVFTLGMMLMEVITLLPSSQCYDSSNFDILDSVINERIILIEEYYNQTIARIIANMLDYDYTERMDMKQMSIWINRQLSSNRPDCNQSRQKLKSEDELSQQKNITKSRISMSRNGSDRNTPELGSITSSKINTQTVQTTIIESNVKSKGKNIKTNAVYMNQGKQKNELGAFTRQDKNKIYINDAHFIADQKLKDGFARDQDSFRPELNKMHAINQNLAQLEGYKINTSQNLVKNKYQNYHDQNKKGYKKTESYFDKDPLERQTQTKRVFQEPLNYYKVQRNEQNSQKQSFEDKKLSQWARKQKTPLKQVSNKYYPSVDQVFKIKTMEKTSYQDIKKNSKASVIKVDEDHQQAKFNSQSESNTNNSISRIKQEILKSRKLIEEFKKSQGLKF